MREGSRLPLEKPRLPRMEVILPSDAMERLPSPQVVTDLPKETLVRIMAMAGPLPAKLLVSANKSMFKLLRKEVIIVCAQYIQRFSRWSRYFSSSRVMAMEFKRTGLTNVNALRGMG